MSKIALILILLVVVLIGLWLFGPRIIRTVVLISLTSPYERHVNGAETVLVLGDSTGYGTGALRKEESIAGRIGADFPKYSIENNSRNGRTIGELVPTAKEIKGKYSLILLQIGGNDILRDREVATVEAELREVISALEDNTEHLVMMSSGNVGGAKAFSGERAALLEARTRDFRDMYLRVASETNMVYVDLFREPQVDPFILEPDRYLAIDGLHPSGEGYGLWYESLEPVLSEQLVY